ncbi:MASE1 domain-containing protein [Nocardia mexicana]|uniref:MASE1 domain-containing protein n=1 Tax=Nocardia mexicana TaxID=279262 RepID=UPI000A06F38D|nr:MASE1 domain-containing protein [Nocardia mexicana]
MERFRGHLVVVLWIVAIAVAYFVSAQIGLRSALVVAQVTPLWPPTGIGVACLLLLGPRVWPGIALGAFATNIVIGPTLPAVFAITVGNTLAPLLAYLLLERVGFRRGFDRLADALALVFLGALAGMLVSATIGSVTLVLTDTIAVQEFWASWSVWWTGDAMGVLTITPLILLATTARKPATWRPLRIAEAVVLVTGTFLVAVAATLVLPNLLFLVFPLLIWAALRFHLAGAMPCALIASVVVIGAAAQEFPAFDGLELTTRMIVVQAFNGSVVLTALLLATITAQRDRARRTVDEACAQLTQAVTILASAHPLAGMTEVLRRTGSVDSG